MKKSGYLALGAVAALACFARIGIAQADSYGVTVWGGYGYMPIVGLPSDGNQDAEAPAPTGAPTATFIYNGPIDWADNTPNPLNPTDPTQNLFRAFFTQADIANFSGVNGLSETNFLNTSMSAYNNAWYTYVQVTGTIQSAGTYYLTSDDGASVYSNTCPQFTCYSSPMQQVVGDHWFTIGAGPFTVDYIEADGPPAVLYLGIPFTSGNPGGPAVPAVPEPSTWAMMLAGFGFLGLIAFRRRRDTGAAIKRLENPTCFAPCDGATIEHARAAAKA